ncbi:phage tail protein [Motilimonas eburnea]|uniref:phage tail protein n=1 Tax=Motilimonas eburnea TaxID=1737488 RepID=UPI001E4EAC6C|nr:tail fiber protein [Motilimonas eburnea]MCE2571195.1 tail fiber protein [Motilimonas eburnea]
MSDPFIGEVRLYGFNFNPKGWAFCAGALMSIAQNSTLFSLLGTIYGGDGRTTFALPDLRGRSAMSKGRHPGSAFDWRIGTAAGTESHALTISEMPSHSHTATFTSTGGGTAAQVLVSTDKATQNAPLAGSYLAVNKNGRLAGEEIYRENAGTGTVALGGVSGGGSGGGTVTIGTTGNNSQFSIIQPVLALNYCIATIGLYPPRS